MKHFLALNSGFVVEEVQLLSISSISTDTDAFFSVLEYFRD